MSNLKILMIGFLLMFCSSSCQDLLNPEPVDLQTNEFVLKDANSARTILSSAYRDFANLGASKIIAGDLTADHLIFNGTFTQYLEISNKDMSTSNGSASAMWGTIYSLTYVTNFLEERLPLLDNISSTTFNEITGAARFMRGYAYFLGATTYGGLPIVTTTDLETNKAVSRASLEETLQFAEDDLLYALDKVPEESFNDGDITNGAVKAALARFYLFAENWSEAEKYATEIIDSLGTKSYMLETSFDKAIDDFSSESILEIVYSANDNPGTSTNFGINNLFSGRRELIPSSEIVEALNSDGGTRSKVLDFDANNARGSDNGWTVTRYGPYDNIPVFRLAEIYLIRAEARAQQDNITGTKGALTDLNLIRARAKVPTVTETSKNEVLLAIEKERQLELAFEGHRWYDIKRTGRAKSIMDRFTNNWTDKDLLWPVPLREIQNNASLKNAQNPGY